MRDIILVKAGDKAYSVVTTKDYKVFLFDYVDEQDDHRDSAWFGELSEPSLKKIDVLVITKTDPESLACIPKDFRSCWLQRFDHWFEDSLGKLAIDDKKTYFYDGKLEVGEIWASADLLDWTSEHEHARALQSEAFARFLVGKDLRLFSPNGNFRRWAKNRKDEILDYEDFLFVNGKYDPAFERSQSGFNHVRLLHSAYDWNGRPHLQIGESLMAKTAKIPPQPDPGAERKPEHGHLAANPLSTV